jgi:hypothetical protein
MPRYLVERTFSDSLALPDPNQAAQARLTFIDNNALHGVTWVHSYIAPDRKKSFPAPCASVCSLARGEKGVWRSYP